jgi:hypothetical protein
VKRKVRRAVRLLSRRRKKRKAGRLLFLRRKCLARCV